MASILLCHCSDVISLAAAYFLLDKEFIFSSHSFVSKLYTAQNLSRVSNWQQPSAAGDVIPTVLAELWNRILASVVPASVSTIN